MSAAQALAISVGGSKHDNAPRIESVTWQQFASRFAKPKITACTYSSCGQGEHAEHNKDGKPIGCRHKDAGYYVPATFSKGRKKKDVQRVSALVVDADHLSDAELAETLAKLERYQYIAHATHSDKPGDRCVRIIIPLSQPVSAADWPRFWIAAMTVLGMPADPSCCDAGRLYYWPARPSDADYFYEVHEGKALDVIEVAKHAPPEEPRIVDSLDVDGDGVVGEGKRHAMLVSMAGALRARGAGEAEILAALTIANKRCNPPKGESELAEIAKWASEQPIGEKWKSPPPSDPDEPKDELAERRRQSSVRVTEGGVTTINRGAGYGEQGGYRCTDLGNARRLVDAHGDKLRFVPAWGSWLAWDGKRWRRDDNGAAQRCAKDVVAALYSAIGAMYQRVAVAANDSSKSAPSSDVIEEMERWAKKSSQRSAIASMLGLAETEIEVVRTPGDFDRDPWLFNVANGTIDLRTGDLHPHRQGDAITRISPVDYDPNAECPQWMAFLRQMQPDDSVRDWIWRWLGHCLTGLFTEQCMAFFIGGGSNGKNVALDAVRHIMGEYAMTAAPDLLIATHNERHPTEIADLDGRRFVVCSEIEQGRQWAESVIKRITGDPKIKARHMREDFYEFDATHKITVAANTKPIVRGTDEGIWRRMRVIEWPVRIPDGSRPGEKDERDKGLTARLIAEESSGILNWLVRGCIEWQKRGLEPPEVIKAATARYRKEQDVLGQWIEDRCTVDRETWHATSSLYRDYVQWCESEGHEPWSRRAWHDRLTERRGIRDGKRGAKSEIRALIGISLRGPA